MIFAGIMSHREENQIQFKINKSRPMGKPLDLNLSRRHKTCFLHINIIMTEWLMQLGNPNGEHFLLQHNRARFDISEIQIRRTFR